MSSYNYNFYKECLFCDVNLLKLSEEKRKEIEAGGHSLDADMEWLQMPLSDIEKYQIPDECVDYVTSSIDWNYLEYDLIWFIGKHPYYVIISKQCKWNDNPGFFYCTNINHSVLRNGSFDYDLIMIENYEDRGIKCIEKEHDASSGSETYIVGLSAEEYEEIKGESYEEVVRFVKKVCGE